MDDDRFSDPVEARKKAMDYLARREYGRGELLDKLIRSGFDSDVANEAVARLIDDGLQDDERFAEAFVRSRINQGKGPQVIRADLRQRGLTRPVIDIAIEAAGEDWYALARDVRLKKFGPDAPLEFRDKARQMRFLRSRGFDSDQIQAAVSADVE
ncbi:MAG: regulatory protein RecX [Woeseiaceae bacterium]|nr:regulatory protein RecX [Woeseiaceae bacterium]NIP21163.1 regulatory protein RecX [Woeseiaceae bacterium]NIS90135.1 regulatory protein RecX [Woeseiaceae bacterium]